MYSNISKHSCARTPFNVGDFPELGKIKGDALLRSTSPNHSLYEILLEDGKSFSLEKVKVSHGEVWASMPFEEYLPVAELIGRAIERALV